MKIYLLPGLGFDHRIFERLDLGIHDVQYLNWIEPELNESIKDYALRFSERIESTDEDILLIGHSLGGIMAQEIAAIRLIHKIILISSIRSRKELPYYFKISKPLLIHKLFSKNLTSKTIKFWGKFHDYVTEEERNLVIDMVNKQSDYYLEWALKQLSIWEKPEVPSSTVIFQIHGDADKTFPFRLIRNADRKIENGGHYMVSREAEIIGEVIREEILK